MKMIFTFANPCAAPSATRTLGSAAPRTRRRLAAPGLALLSVASLGWAARGAGLEDLDSANFRLGMDAYDLARHQPHFPGYPVYLAVARALRSMGVGSVEALQLPGIAAWGVGVAVFTDTITRRWGWRTAALAAALTAASPLAVVTVGRAGSDAMGAGVALFGACAAWRAGTGSLRWAVLAGIAAGLLPGIRLSAAPLLVAPLLWAAGRVGPAPVLAGMVAGGASWLVPFVAVVGPAALVAEAGPFVAGHFLQWGGTPFVGDAGAIGAWGAALAAWASAASHAAWGLSASPSLNLAGLWTLVVATAVASASRRPDRGAMIVVLVTVLPYVAWLIVGQNPDHPRHLLPLMPFMALLLAVGLARLGAAQAWAGAAVLAALSGGLAAEHRSIASPGAQLARWATDEWAGRAALGFTGTSERLVYQRDRSLRVEYAADADGVFARLGAMRSRPPVLWVTSEVRDPDGRLAALGPWSEGACFARGLPGDVPLIVRVARASEVP